ncbi:energy transducer TonB [Burkholderia anthina]|uniref:energy transducer TonB n=1 Tax=Burkholderia anthina TaxID=179879 RepID=UPI001CF32C60|nr:energy transducer TonB [Burkholderia anthina]MCA8095241.1 energy transducer TonB [Burkholderia anthina]
MSTSPSFHAARQLSDHASPPDAHRVADWRQPGIALGGAVVLHVVVLLLFLLQPTVSITQADAGRRVSGAGLRVTLVATPAPPVKSTQAAVPPRPVVKHTAQRHPVLLTSKAPAARSVTENETPTPPTPVAPAVPAAEAATATAAAVEATAAAPVNPALNLPGAQAAKDVAHVACHFDQPAYPARARRLAHEGTVTLSVTVDRTGRVARADVASSSGYEELDAAAQSALLAGHCDPYVEHGVAIDVHAVQPVTFGLDH